MRLVGEPVSRPGLPPAPIGKPPAGAERVHQGLDLELQLFGKDFGGVMSPPPARSEVRSNIDRLTHLDDRASRSTGRGK